MTGREVPPSSQYDGFPQIEDGIGITRHLLENLAGVMRRTKTETIRGSRGIVACGTMIGPTMRKAVGEMNERLGTDLDVVVVENRYFGSGRSTFRVFLADRILQRRGGKGAVVRYISPAARFPIARIRSSMI